MFKQFSMTLMAMNLYLIIRWKVDPAIITYLRGKGFSQSVVCRNVQKKLIWRLMKKSLLILAIFLSSASFASDAQIITSTLDGEVTIGFTDSSFDYAVEDTDHKKNFCYMGSISKVCRELKNDSSIINDRYLQGAHDDIEIRSCEIIEDMDSDGYHPVFGSERVVASYRLSDDYGSDFVVTRVIRKCSRISGL
jgi:hypothetical protein